MRPKPRGRSFEAREGDVNYEVRELPKQIRVGKCTRVGELSNVTKSSSGLTLI